MNCQAVAEAEKNMVFAARLTQQGHKIASMDDLMELYEKSFSVQTVAAMGALPHPTIQKFAVITVAIVGASRRFLAQITRHRIASFSVQSQRYVRLDDFRYGYRPRLKLSRKQLYGTGGFRCPVFYYDGSGSGTGTVLKKL